MVTVVALLQSARITLFARGGRAPPAVNPDAVHPGARGIPGHAILMTGKIDCKVLGVKNGDGTDGVHVAP